MYTTDAQPMPSAYDDDSMSTSTSSNAAPRSYDAHSATRRPTFISVRYSAGACCSVASEQQQQHGARGAASLWMSGASIFGALTHLIPGFSE